MIASSNLESALAHCGSTPQLLDILCRQLHANHRHPDRITETRDLAMRLAKEDGAFGEYLNDAICLYLQRAESGLEKAGPEFEPLIEMLTELKRPHSVQHLMAWIDRHRTMSHPTEAQEKRFALAIWSLVTTWSSDSKLFIDWWTERVKLHRGDWLATYFDPEALATS